MTRFDLESISNDGPLGAIEFCYRMGWSDGLPVVPPTESRVREFLDYAGRESSDVILVEPVAGRVVTAEKAAANAVMAGCLPEYFPVVLAAAFSAVTTLPATGSTRITSEDSRPA
jgi:hypothetical protein